MSLLPYPDKKSEYSIFLNLHLHNFLKSQKLKPYTIIIF